MDKRRRISNRPPNMFRSDFSRMSLTGHSHHRFFKLSSRAPYNNRYVEFKVGPRLSLFTDYYHYLSKDPFSFSSSSGS